MAPQDRLSQINKHLNYPQGLLAGQVAIITGAGQGIGAEAARLFANEGAKVVVADIDAGEFRFLFAVVRSSRYLNDIFVLSKFRNTTHRKGD
jgi:Dehydrogenases with different specificities (related to short-chain alcohol dehydrogenases)